MAARSKKSLRERICAMSVFDFSVIILGVLSACLANFASSKFSPPYRIDLPVAPNERDFSAVIENSIDNPVEPDLISKLDEKKRASDAVSLYTQLLKTKLKYDAAVEKHNAFFSVAYLFMFFVFVLSLFISYFVIWKSYLSIAFYIGTFALCYFILTKIRKSKYAYVEFPEKVYDANYESSRDISYADFIMNWKKEVSRSETIALNAIADMESDIKSSKDMLSVFGIIYLLAVGFFNLI